ncbi:MAG: hypothetical protein AABN33_13035, partial [Acidobacteriota bacterium]
WNVDPTLTRCLTLGAHPRIVHTQPTKRLARDIWNPTNAVGGSFILSLQNYWRASFGPGVRPPDRRPDMNDPPTALVGFNSDPPRSCLYAEYEQSTNCVGGFHQLRWWSTNCVGGIIGSPA